MSRSSRIFFGAIVAFLCGVLGFYFGWELLWILLGCVVVGGFLFWRYDRREWLTVFVIILLAVLGYGRASGDKHVTTPQSVDYYNGSEDVTLRGYVGWYPDVRSTHQNLDVVVREGVVNGETKELEGTVRVSVNRYPEWSLGDWVEVGCDNLEKPAEFEGFSYKDYLARYEIYAVCYYPEINAVEAGELSGWEEVKMAVMQPLFEMKVGFEGKINQVYPEPGASFLAGLLVGSRKGIPDEITESFNLTGLTHIVAISGFNITIVIVFFGVLVGWMPRKLRLVLTAVGIVLFTLLVGASAAVVRAAVMGLLGILAVTNYRQQTAARGLALATFFMVLATPKMLVWDTGFQMSVLATGGLIFVYPVLDEWLKGVVKNWQLREMLALTLAAQAAVVPILVLNFERLSLISPVANVAVLPFVPFVMLFGFAGVLVGFGNVMVGKVVGVLAWAGLKYIVAMAVFLAGLPYSSVEIGFFSPVLMVIYYVLLVVVLLRWYGRRG